MKYIAIKDEIANSTNCILYKNIIQWYGEPTKQFSGEETHKQFQGDTQGGIISGHNF